MSETQRPYVVSGDTEGLMKSWGESVGRKMPSRGFYESLNRTLVSNLKVVFPDNPVELINEDMLRSEMGKMVKRTSLFTISLDRAYLNTNSGVNGFIDVTRAVNPKFEDLGLKVRPGSLSFEQQLESFRSQTPDEVAIVDDVVFGGAGMLEIVRKLREQNRIVKTVFVGVGIGEGVELLRGEGIKVECVREYPEVVDEICQRDFFAGVPMSGRTVVDGERWYSAPYFKPFGNPEKWASIPAEQAVSFSQACIASSINLWQEVARTSGNSVLNCELPRTLLGLDPCEIVTIALQGLV